MKTEEPQDLVGALGRTHFQIGSRANSLEIFVSRIEGGAVASIRSCRPPFERVLPDCSGRSFEDAFWAGVLQADGLLHEGDRDRAQKIMQLRGQMIFMLAELAR
jgi:hypothetical protein